MKYRVDCWINPRSGEDLIRHNQVINFLNEIVSKLGNNRVENVFKEFSGKNEGMILKEFILVKFEKVENARKDLMPLIWKNFPEAQLASWCLIEEE